MSDQSIYLTCLIRLTHLQHNSSLRNMSCRTGDYLCWNKKHHWILLNLKGPNKNVLYFLVLCFSELMTQRLMLFRTLLLLKIDSLWPHSFNPYCLETTVEKAMKQRRDQTQRGVNTQVILLCLGFFCWKNYEWMSPLLQQALEARMLN